MQVRVPPPMPSRLRFCMSVASRDGPEALTLRDSLAEEPVPGSRQLLSS